jgi:hypothetical protein
MEAPLSTHYVSDAALPEVAEQAAVQRERDVYFYLRERGAKTRGFSAPDYRDHGGWSGSGHAARSGDVARNGRAR